MAMPTREPNDFPTAVMLATDSALWPIARVSSTSTKQRRDAARQRAHAPDDERQDDRQHGRRPPQPDAIEHAADRQADRRTEERRPQVDVGVGDAIELEVSEHGLGDEAQALRPAGQRREHDDRRDDDVHPAEAVGAGSAVQRRPGVGIVEVGVGDMRLG